MVGVGAPPVEVLGVEAGTGGGLECVAPALDGHGAQAVEGRVAAVDQTLLTHTRRWGLRDRYVTELLVPELDWRLAVALAIVLDAMQSR